jgi:hypothetical protein
MERLAVLARLGLEFDVDAVRGQLGQSLVAGDDVIDAAIMLATPPLACRIAGA